MSDLNGEKNNDINLISYRLTQLENGLRIVQDTLKNISEQLNKMTPLQIRVTDLEAQMKNINDKIVELENAPYKKDAGKWQTALSWILQALTLACMALLLTKVGLK